MSIIKPRKLDADTDGGARYGEEDAEAFEPMTAEQAKAWRAAQPNMSAWFTLAWQCLAVAVVGGATAMWVGEAQAKSLIYGGVAVIVPAALMVLGMNGSLMRRLSAYPAGPLLGFAILELIKLLLSVGLMFAAPQAVENLSWLAMLVGVVVALKVHWLVLGFRTMRARRVV